MMKEVISVLRSTRHGKDFFAMGLLRSLEWIEDKGTRDQES